MEMWTVTSQVPRRSRVGRRADCRLGSVARVKEVLHVEMTYMGFQSKKVMQNVIVVSSDIYLYLAPVL